MTTPSADIADVTFDCTDPECVALFWSSLLGRPIGGRKGPYVWLQRTASGVGLGFQRVPEPKRGKNRVHLDISSQDIVGLTERIEELGGHRLDLYDGGFLVMTDPEGNEFCVVPTEPLQFDADGKTQYLENLEP
jgi:predicted enzyme related to lactoylglutathione lyase